jgi:hypothetical protein
MSEQADVWPFTVVNGEPPRPWTLALAGTREDARGVGCVKSVRAANRLISCVSDRMMPPQGWCVVVTRLR